MRLLIFLSVLLVFQSARAQDDDLLSEARRHYEEANFQQAIALLDRVISEKEDNYDAWLLKGNCFQKEEKFVAAIQAYETASKSGPNSAILNANHGNALINLQQWGAAEKKLRQALKIDSELPEAHYYMGNVKYFNFNLSAAIRHYDKAIELKPEYRDALYMRAAAYAELEEYGKALGDYEKVLELDPDLEVARFNAAVIRLRDNQYAEASELLETIDASNLPQPRDLYFYRGEALYFSGQKEDACAAYERAKEMGDKEAEEIFLKYCVEKQERKEEPKTRTIRMAF